MKNKIEVSCCLCGEKHIGEYEIPEGWGFRYNGDAAIEDAFCPAHKIIEQWCDAVCPCCVGGWMDCSFWRSFAYNKWEFTQKDLDIIKSGYCPRRTNGTMAVQRTESGIHISHPDLSDRAPRETGVALVNAILEYWNKYHPQDKKHDATR